MFMKESKLLLIPFSAKNVFQNWCSRSIYSDSVSRSANKISIVKTFVLNTFIILQVT